MLVLSPQGGLTEAPLDVAEKVASGQNVSSAPATAGFFQQLALAQ